MGEGLLALADLVPAIDVEQAHRLQFWTRAGQQRRLDLSSSDALVDDQGDVLMGHGRHRDGLRLHCDTAGGDEGIDVELAPDGARRDPQRRSHLRVQLTDVPRKGAVRQREPGAPAGVEGHRAVG